MDLDDDEILPDEWYCKYCKDCNSKPKAKTNNDVEDDCSAAKNSDEDVEDDCSAAENSNEDVEDDCSAAKIVIAENNEAGKNAVPKKTNVNRWICKSGTGWVSAHFFH